MRDERTASGRVANSGSTPLKRGKSAQTWRRASGTHSRPDAPCQPRDWRACRRKRRSAGSRRRASVARDPRSTLRPPPRRRRRPRRWREEREVASRRPRAALAHHSSAETQQTPPHGAPRSAVDGNEYMLGTGNLSSEGCSERATITAERRGVQHSTTMAAGTMPFRAPSFVSLLQASAMNPPAEQQPRRPKRQQQQHARVAPTASTSSSKPSSDDEQERRTPTLNTTLSELALDIEDDYASSSHESDDDDEDHASSFHAPPHADSSDSEDDDDGAPAQVQSKHQLHIDTARLSSPPSQRLRERSHSSPAISTTPHGTTSTAGKRTEHWVDKAILRQLALESLESVDGEQEAVSRLANLVVPGGGGATRPRVRERSHTSAVDQLEPSSPAENKRRDKERLETVRKEFGWSCADEELVAEVVSAAWWLSTQGL